MIFIKDISPIILNLPIIIAIIAGTRYIIGFKTWRNYSTLVLALSFFLINEVTHQLLLTSLVWTVFLVAIIGGAVLARYLIRHLKVNYYGRVSLVYLGGITTLFLALFIPQVFFGFEIFKETYVMIGAFLIGTTIDDLATLHFKKDIQEFTRRIVTTTILGLISGMLISWQWWNNFLGSHQEILLFVLLIDLIIAFWTNIRLTELLRFKSISRS